MRKLHGSKHYSQGFGGESGVLKGNFWKRDIEYAGREENVKPRYREAQKAFKCGKACKTSGNCMGYKLFGLDSDLEYKLDQKITEQQQMKEIISEWGQRKGKDFTNVISKNEYFIMNSRQDTRYRPTF